jgi:hypothetical protein
MLQQLRHSRDLIWKGTRVTLTDPARFARKVSRMPVQVSGAMAQQQNCAAA